MRDKVKSVFFFFFYLKRASFLPFPGISGQGRRRDIKEKKDGRIAGGKQGVSGQSFRPPVHSHA